MTYFNDGSLDSIIIKAQSPFESKPAYAVRWVLNGEPRRAIVHLKTVDSLCDAFGVADASGLFGVSIDAIKMYVEDTLLPLNKAWNESIALLRDLKEGRDAEMHLADPEYLPEVYTFIKVLEESESSFDLVPV